MSIQLRSDLRIGYEGENDLGQEDFVNWDCCSAVASSTMEPATVKPSTMESSKRTATPVKSPKGTVSTGYSGKPSVGRCAEENMALRNRGRAENPRRRRTEGPFTNGRGAKGSMFNLWSNEFASRLEASRTASHLRTRKNSSLKGSARPFSAGRTSVPTARDDRSGAGLDLAGTESLGRKNPTGHRATQRLSVYRINDKYPVVSSVKNMVGNYQIMVVEMDVPVEVMEDEESIKEESPAKEGEGDPGIKIIIIPGRRVVSDNRRAVIIVVVVDYLGGRSGFWNFTGRTARPNV